MKTEEDVEDLAGPLFSSHERLAKLERQLYGHVREAIDFERLHCFEQHLWSVMKNRFSISETLAFDLASQMIERAIARAAYDPVRHGITTVPLGITEAERKAVAFEDDCSICKVLAKLEAKPPEPEVDEEGEPCPCCDIMAAEWREKHAEALSKAGLSPPEHEHAAKGMPS